MEQDGLTATGFYALATGAAATALATHIPTDGQTPAVYQARAALVRAVGASVNMTLDNSTPTAAAGGGYPVLTSDTGGFWIYGLANLLRLKVIAQSGTGTLNVIFFN